MKQPVVPARLPVWTVFKRSFAYAWERRDVLAAPYLIYAAITIAADLAIQYGFGDGNEAGTALGFAIDEIFAMAFAVGIQRFVLLGEAGRGAGFFRWDRSFAEYLLTAALLAVAMAAVATVFGSATLDLGGLGQMTAQPTATPTAGALSLLLLVAMIGIAAIFARLLLLLPAAALGQRERLGLIWGASRGNGLRLLAALLLVMLPFVVVQLSLTRDALTSMSDAGDAKVELGLGAQIALGLISPIQLIVLTIMLALDYDALVRGGGPSTSIEVDRSIH